MVQQYAILTLSILLQFTAAFHAIRLIRITGKVWAWILIAGALFLMGVRRSITLYHLVQSSSSIQPDLTAELMAMLISGILLTGMTLIGPLFRSIGASRQQSEETTQNLNALMENANEGILVHAGGIHIFANQAATQMLGYTTEELREIDIEGLLAPDQIEKVRDGFNKRMAGANPPAHYETVFVNKKGIHFPVEITAARTVWDGMPAGMAIFRDITERKIKDTAIRDSEELLSDVIDHMQDIIYRTDINGSLIWTTSSVTNILGYEPRELHRRPLSDYFRNIADYESYLDILGNNRGKLNGFETQFIHKDSSYIWLSMNARYYMDANGAIAGIEGACREITKRKLVQEELIKRARQQNAVAALGLKAVEDAGLVELMNEAIHMTSEILDSKYSSVLELQESEDNLLLIAGTGWQDGLVGSTTIANDPQTQIGYTLRSTKPITTSDLSKEFRFQGPELFLSHDVVSSLSVIIQSRGVPYGIFGIHSKDSIQYTLNDVHFVQATANILGAAIAGKKAEDEARRSANLIDRANDAIYVLEPETGALVYSNFRSTEMLGYDRADLQKMQMADINPLYENKDTWYKHVQMVRENGYHLLTTRHRTRDGNFIDVEVSAGYISESNRDYIVSVARDISERKKTEEQLNLASMVFENTNEGILVVDTSGIIRSANPAFARMTGYPIEQINNKTLTSVGIDVSSLRPRDAAWQQTLSAGTWQGELHISKKNGESLPVWLNISSIRDEYANTVSYVAVMSDITKIKKTEDRLNYMAHHDPLTDLPNRVLFQDRLEQSLARSNRTDGITALLFLDLDRFKVVNDTLGHVIGDHLLKEVANRLRENIRESDTIARLGGDEFTVILQETHDTAGIGHVAQKIIDDLNDVFIIDGHELFINASIGISVYPYDGKDWETLLKHADIAMYHAKDQGRNNYQFFSKKMSDLSMQKLKMESALRQALDKDELVLLFQPQLDLKSGRITGFEVLTYWDSADGRIAPGQFIPVAEETGLINPLGEWVLYHACRQTRLWQQEGLASVPVAVNLSARQFQQKNLLEMLDRILSETKLDPAYLQLEITESMLMQVDRTLAILHGIKERGIHISIDDFGTGYSSLSYLKRFPLSNLKIDRSFIIDVVNDHDDAVITQVIIDLGHSLNLDLTAEGVETREQLRFLQLHGCDKAQGYFFGKPMEKEKFHEYLIDSGINRMDLWLRQNKIEQT